MKKHFILLGFVAAVAWVGIDAVQQKAYARTMGSPGGYTGSGSDGRTCGTNGGCHGGGSTFIASSITHNIPATGYVVGETYMITVSVSQNGISKFGFECTAENGSNIQVGTMVANPSVQINTTGAGTGHITHRTSSTSGSSGSNSWSFEWAAPYSNQGDVTFYAAMLAANSSNNTSGDFVYNSSSTVVASNSVGIEKTVVEPEISVYPNPTTDFIYINAIGMDLDAPQLRVITLDGKSVLDWKTNGNVSLHRLSVQHLTAGNYILQFKNKNKIYSKNIAIH